MLKIVFALAVALIGFSGLPALAGALQITDDDPIAVVTVPDAWTTAKIKRGVEIKTPDDEIYLWFELVAPDQIETLQKEHNGYFDKEGVTITGSSETMKQEVKGKAWSFTGFQGQEQGRRSAHPLRRDQSERPERQDHHDDLLGLARRSQDA